ncbi:hypothetical protein ASNO1_41880 [Corallococcus caeni]|uniref:Uncharacterized protein n=1 Tax=Corallococcus caeni TaxID=3082388 RepID=A0ABQ6QV75_9BACT|nr:hypothetical protein ASNO1_41880 [Corallococcus sp. NO1]
MREGIDKWCRNLKGTALFGSPSACGRRAIGRQRPVLQGSADAIRSADPDASHYLASDKSSHSMPVISSTPSLVE